jgi:hypothetical protein
MTITTMTISVDQKIHPFTSIQIEALCGMSPFKIAPQVGVVNHSNGSKHRD